MCLSADEVNPLCDECFGKYKEAASKGVELKDEDLCDECRDLPNHYCFCCERNKKFIEEDLGIIDGICKRCREM